MTISDHRQRLAYATWRATTKRLAEHFGQHVTRDQFKLTDREVTAWVEMQDWSGRELWEQADEIEKSILHEALVTSKASAMHAVLFGIAYRQASDAAVSAARLYAQCDAVAGYADMMGAFVRHLSGERQ